jgi:hypothetical protein
LFMGKSTLRPLTTQIEKPRPNNEQHSIPIHYLFTHCHMVHVPLPLSFYSLSLKHTRARKHTHTHTHCTMSRCHALSHTVIFSRTFSHIPRRKLPCPLAHTHHAHIYGRTHTQTHYLSTHLSRKVAKTPKSIKTRFF